MYHVAVAGWGSTRGNIVLNWRGPGQPRAAAIKTQPQSKSRRVGQAVTLTVVGIGQSTLRYQWRKNGTNIPGATSATYRIGPLQASDEGVYSCVVQNPLGVAVSTGARLMVAP